MNSMSRLRLLSAIVSLLILPATVAYAEGESDAAPSSSVCEIPEARQFDFWIGDWIGYSSYKDSTGREIPYTVRNTIMAELDSCVIVENFKGGPVAQLDGMSVSTFDAYTSQWRQTWVDDQRGYLDFAGGFADGVMGLRRTATRNDTTFLQRMRWMDIKPDTFTWRWELSDDDGATWRTLWKIRYERIQ